ncbi:hypothetical protein K402DRAFT_36582 [Aulographum hederae CBS 113979]|uniref:DUF7918 domain-containing protein n=1 Tax=Aulographum hederae CBS 113979 TaxID=1176131 RepID=A0A6G1H3W3_9PEZI|nr:hypothetical protein K402DRAFT_36582 [Aulographum hederae CBS 113979]
MFSNLSNFSSADATMLTRIFQSGLIRYQMLMSPVFQLVWTIADKTRRHSLLQSVNTIRSRSAVVCTLCYLLGGLNVRVYKIRVFSSFKVTFLLIQSPVTAKPQTYHNMAIHDDVPGLEVYVCVDGEPLQEYDGANVRAGSAGDDSVVTFIEAVPGAEFKVRLDIRRKFIYTRHGLDATVCLDGEDMDQPFTKIEKNSSYTITGLLFTEVGQWKVKPFVFPSTVKDKQNEMPKTARAQSRQLEKKINNFGNIAVSIYEAKHVYNKSSSELPFGDIADTVANMSGREGMKAG